MPKAFSTSQPWMKSQTVVSVIVKNFGKNIY